KSISYLVGESQKKTSPKDRKSVTTDLLKICVAASSDEALMQLENINIKLGEQYPNIIQAWRDEWSNITGLFDYPPPVRQLIDVGNKIKSMTSAIQKACTEKRASL